LPHFAGYRSRRDVGTAFTINTKGGRIDGGGAATPHAGNGGLYESFAGHSPSPAAQAAMHNT
jgi:hypothetical protein